MMHQKNITKQELCDDLSSLGLRKGDIVNVKASLKSIGYIDGGAKTLLDSLLTVVGKEGMIFTESFRKMYPKVLINKRKKKHIANYQQSSYAGALANVILDSNNVKLNEHPTHRYAGIGRGVEEVLKNHGADDDPYEILARIAELGGKNLRIGPKEKVVGVGTTHIALNKLRLKQKRPKMGIYYYNENEKLKLFENWWATGCEKAFNDFMSFFEGTDAIIAYGSIGNAPALLTSMQKTLEIELETISKNPKSVLCSDPGCPKCSLTWEFSDGSYLDCFKYNLKVNNYKNAFHTILYYFNNNYLPKN